MAKTNQKTHTEQWSDIRKCLRSKILNQNKVDEMDAGYGYGVKETTKRCINTFKLLLTSFVVGFCSWMWYVNGAILFEEGIMCTQVGKQTHR